jgi:small-conductance mechanosensitive channel
MTMLEILVILAVCAVAAAAGWLTSAALRLAGRRRPVLRHAAQRCRSPWMATLAATAALSSIPAASVHGDAESVLRHTLVLALIGSVTWLGVRVAQAIENAAFSRLPVDVSDNRRTRKMRTQISVLRRIAVAVLVAVGAAAALMTFPQMRTFGASLLASAGLAGIIGGLAAQSTLTNVFAGLQLAFTDALRIDDVVVVEQEWGRVEELTLTHVVVRLWDDRRLVLPTTYFTTRPFQNWTRTTAAVLGSVILHLDHRTPIDRLRTEAGRVVAVSPLWDGRTWTVQVTDTDERTIQVRILASAADASSAFDLRCEIRERLLAWIGEHSPESLPRTRLDAGNGALADAAGSRW